MTLREEVKMIKQAVAQQQKKKKKVNVFKQANIQSLEQNKEVRFRQVYIPSTTSLAIAGGATYVASGQFTTGVGSATFWSFYCQAADISSSTNLSGNYDQYRINKIKLWKIPFDKVNTTALTGRTLSYELIDFDDSSVMTTVNQALEVENVKITHPYEVCCLEFIPRVAVTTGAGFSNVKPQWLDCANLTIPHYGAKGVMPIQTVTASFWFVAEVDISYRSHR